MKLIFKSLLALAFTFNVLSAQTVSIGERHSFQSQILKETRSYQVYLPPSYHSNPTAKFPVMYLLDGDYNFHYDSGLIEFLSNAAFTIPEMIMVGISDNGSTKQLENSDPKKNADTFIKFIQSELKPLINSKYRTTNLDILAGHSKFGILATHYWMTQPNDFDVFLAIDPSYWFNDYEITKRLETQLKDGASPTSKLIIAQANTQGMGIDEFVAVLKKEAPNASNWMLNQYLEDNHGSLHLKAVTDALNNVFKGWDLDRETFYTLKDGHAVIDYYKKLNDKYASEFLLPWYSLGNITYFYIRNKREEDLKFLEDGIKKHFPASLEEFRIQLAANYMAPETMQKAEKLYNVCLESNPKSYKALEGLSKIYLAKKDTKNAKLHLEKALLFAKELKARQYVMNTLLETLTTLNK